MKYTPTNIEHAANTIKSLANVICFATYEAKAQHKKMNPNAKLTDGKFYAIDDARNEAKKNIRLLLENANVRKLPATDLEEADLSSIYDICFTIRDILDEIEYGSYHD